MPFDHYAINKAVANRDRVVVGPGIYGDINQDGDFNDPGDESGGRIVLNKAVTVVSLSGAAGTVLKVPVDITANGARFGEGDNARDKGLHLVYHGIEIKANRVVVEKNLLTENAAIRVAEDVARPAANGTVETILIRHNLLVALSFSGRAGGLFLKPSDETTLIVENNTIVGRDGGIKSNSDRPKTRFKTIIRNNTVSNATVALGISCEDGLCDHEISRNTFAANQWGIVQVLPGSNDTTPLLVTENTLVGNERSVFDFGDYMAGEVVFKKNNVFGNGEVWPLSPDDDLYWYRVFPPAEALFNCAIARPSGIDSLDARNNYWGASTGPGENPADFAPCPGFTDWDGGVYVPFARKPFPIYP